MDFRLKPILKTNMRGARTFFGTSGLGYFKLGNSRLPLAGSGIHHFNFSESGIKYFFKREFGIRPFISREFGIRPLPTHPLIYSHLGSFHWHKSSVEAISSGRFFPAAICSAKRNSKAPICEHACPNLNYLKSIMYIFVYKCTCNCTYISIIIILYYLYV